MDTKGTRYIHKEDVSQAAHDLQQALYDNHVKGLFAAVMADSVPAELLALVGMDDATTAAAIPEDVASRYDVTSTPREGREVWRLTPKQGGTEKVIFYIHGGGYVVNITKAHWEYLDRLSAQTGATLIVPDYPLVPSATQAEAYAVVEAAYLAMLESVAVENVYVMGDSAGGGMSVAFAQKLRDEQKPLPRAIIVLSPWLDVTLEDPAIDAVEDRDHFLGSRGLRQAGRAYAGDLDPRDPLVSPTFGSFDGLPPLSIFQGTHDIFVVESRKLVARLDSEGVSVNFYEYPGQCHIWAVFPSPESDSAVAQMAGLISA